MNELPQSDLQQMLQSAVIAQRVGLFGISSEHRAASLLDRGKIADAKGDHGRLKHLPRADLGQFIHYEISCNSDAN